MIDYNSLGQSGRIIATIREFGGNIQLDFLAFRLGRRTEEIMSDLQDLKKLGVIKVDANKNLVQF